MMTLLFAALELHAHDTLLPHHEADFKQLADRRALAAALTVLFVLGLAAAAVFIYKNADAETDEADDP